MVIVCFVLGFIGVGFVIGICMVSEWFLFKELGMVEGIYGGWGNFGFVVVVFILFILVVVFGGDDGWCYVVVIIGVLCVIFSVIYYINVIDMFKGFIYF